MSGSRHDWLEPGAHRVAPGVHRIPLPLPNDGLRAVNVYAIEDGDRLVPEVVTSLCCPAVVVIPSQEKEISSKIVLRMSPRRVMENTR